MKSITMHKTSSTSIDSPDMRRAGRGVLSLALMDARNHSLHLLSQYEQSLGADWPLVPMLPELNPPLWELGHVGWFQEWWIGRNLQRQLGRRCDPAATRLASIEPQADRWWNSSEVAHDSRWALDLPDMARIKTYLLDTLESTLELLEKAPDEDDALYFYRLALFHEDMHGEALIYMAQTLGLPLSLNMPGAAPVREPLLVPAMRWQLGIGEGGAEHSGFTFDNERPMHEVQVPEFEIDAQVVSWAQFVEFVDDGGYDRPELWQPQGWQWLQDKAAGEGRRGPRYVEQIGVASGAVMQTRFGTARRMLGGQPVMHVTWWEADAWCRWAGRRLPAEVEWEAAAHHAARRGFRWGDVWEWTGTTFRPYPGFSADPYRDYSEPWFGTHKVLRGASFATRARMKNPKYRNFFLPGRDDIFAGFRSCSL
ncbi:selenoneine synthase SenA [Rhodoferax sp.]|uniref:selenoneine synthase SenA n=1 Tax=Rhodoferax sp. TaxID=50421 RepID=UPI0027189699|nr:selenoneine synthase SenA [Rhodoferax sp.]MDO9198195.1 selenoneine synthase SenA [Rhodoferax sp.]